MHDPRFIHTSTISCDNISAPVHSILKRKIMEPGVSVLFRVICPWFIFFGNARANKKVIRGLTRHQNGTIRLQGIFRHYSFPIFTSISSSDAEGDPIFCTDPPYSLMVAETSLSSFMSSASQISKPLDCRQVRHGPSSFSVPGIDKKIGYVSDLNGL